MRVPRITTRQLIVVVALVGCVLGIIRLEPWLAAWLLVLAMPAASWTGAEVRGAAADGLSLGRAERVVIFCNAFFWCVMAVTTLIATMIVISSGIDALG